MILILITFLCIRELTCLSGSTVASYCHCDLTVSFCDFNCCCDLDCSSSPSASCFNSNSNSYCPDPTFFQRLGSSYLNSQGCFYYNSSNTIIEQVSLSSVQINQTITQQQPINRVSTLNSPVKPGYQLGDILSIGTQSAFYFVQASGVCFTASSTSSTAFQLKFGVSMRLSCLCNNCTVVPLLYSTFSGKSVYSYSKDTSKTVSFPVISDPAITSLQINIIIGTYGSNGGKYIERISSSISTTASSVRTLNLVFVQPSQIQSGSSSSSFFPQIPQDMFYPIYQQP